MIQLLEARNKSIIAATLRNQYQSQAFFSFQISTLFQSVWMPRKGENWTIHYNWSLPNPSNHQAWQSLTQIHTHIYVHIYINLIHKLFPTVYTASILWHCSCSGYGIYLAQNQQSFISGTIYGFLSSTKSNLWERIRSKPWVPLGTPKERLFCISDILKKGFEGSQWKGEFSFFFYFLFLFILMCGFLKIQIGSERIIKDTDVKYMSNRKIMV